MQLESFIDVWFTSEDSRNWKEFSEVDFCSVRIPTVISSKGCVINNMTVPIFLNWKSRCSSEQTKIHHRQGLNRSLKLFKHYSISPQVSSCLLKFLHLMIDCVQLELTSLSKFKMSEFQLQDWKTFQEVNPSTSCSCINFPRFNFIDFCYQSVLCR